MGLMIFIVMFSGYNLFVLVTLTDIQHSSVAGSIS